MTLCIHSVRKDVYKRQELLFKIISDRSERGSVIVTTNLPFSQWTQLFENTTMVAALVDRLTFKSYVLNMNGDVYKRQACSLGLSVLFKNAATLSTELAEARDSYTLGRLEKRIQKVDLLILDRCV